MKTHIYYYSQAGHTKKYAESIKNRLEDTLLFTYKEINKKNLKDADVIVYLGPVRNNKIVHLDKLLKHYEKIKEKKICVVSVGMQPQSQDRKEGIIVANGLKFYHVLYYELLGGFDMNKLSKFTQKVMKFGLKYALKKDKSLQGQEQRIKDFLSYPFEYDDLNGIEKIVHDVRILQRQVKSK